MNIVYFSMDGSENEGLQNTVTEKLQALHSRNPNLSGAQVNFRQESDKTGAGKVCEIDLTHYGEPLHIRKSAVSYELAAQDALAELTHSLEQPGKPIPS